MTHLFLYLLPPPSHSQLLPAKGLPEASAPYAMLYISIL
jgi:hypothetical protein